ncbi:MAG: YdcF family protein [Lachnospiraceae bacterium]|nr:YdcF family protein [Lachnospiraceae bacterium]
MWTWIRVALYAILAIFSAGYGNYVRSAGTGSRFYRIWFAAAAVLGLLAVLAACRVWGHFPKSVKIGIVAAICLGIIVFAAVEIGVATGFSGDDGDVDYLIVLGAQVREDGPSLVLRYRLDTAVEYLTEHPDTVCIVSGGQGENEPYPEADGMAEYLIKHGISAERIRKESASTNTAENLKYSLELLPSADAKVGIVTNNFHMFRAKAIARACGYTNISAVVAESKPSYLLHNMVREFAGVCKDLLAGNMKLR